VGHDLDAARMAGFLHGPAASRAVTGVSAPTELAASLGRPRRILVMVPAGRPVDEALARLRPHLDSGDVLIDGGNSFFRDTDRRCDQLAAEGLHLLGTGVSGGQQGALKGPALMSGGPREAWAAVAPILSAIAARADDGDACLSYLGPRGSGHYVKMVHNGIEYGDMQLIAETYDLLTRGAGMSASELADVFADWNTGELRSYLIDITARVLARLDPETGRPLVDVILDEAEQNGTGRWTAQDAFEIGAPIPIVNAALDARFLSNRRNERIAASSILRGPATHLSADRQRLINAARHALYAGRIVSYAQGFALLRQASRQYAYEINLAEVARVWRGGCIIRAALLDTVRDAFRRDPELVNLLLDESVAPLLGRCQEAWRFVVQAGIACGIPLPALSASLAYYDTYRSARLPANLTQAQRDFFGAHTYRRIDRSGTLHTDWSDGTEYGPYTPPRPQ
jgi:6-phosphogluconate dehydrogenase